MFFFSKLITSIVCSLKDSQICFMQSLPLYTLRWFSILSNDDAVGTEKPDGTCLPTFAIDEFSGLFFH